MSVRNCAFPWHWMLVTNDGDVLPCSHGSKSVGNLRENSIEEIWNGTTMKAVRASLLRGEVHRVCESSECPFQRKDAAFPESGEPLNIKEGFARAFDEEWYLGAYADVRDAVSKRRLASGLEHFIRHGRMEGRNYRLVERERRNAWAKSIRAIGDLVRLGLGLARRAEKPLPNAVLALVEYSLGATQLRSRPVDIVVVISTICNLRCVMCPHGMGLVDRPRHMPLDLMEKMESFLTTASRMIVSGLGEPMMAPAFWWIIEKTRGREDLFIRVNSNGHFITSEKAARLLDSALAEISFSLDAATSSTYARIRGGDFGNALNGVSTLLRLGKSMTNRRLDVFINMTLMLENVSEAASFVALGAQLGADGIIFSQLFSFGDRPDWMVDRPDWRFKYSEQMLGRDPAEARRQIARAKAAADDAALPVHFLSNVLGYLNDLAVA